jgi:hypothetical protein
VHQVARRRVGAGPDRDREQHDVHRREARHAEPRQQIARLAFLGLLGGLGRVERMHREAEALGGGGDVRRARRTQVELDGQPFGGEVGARRAHAGHSAQALFQRGDAAAAMHSRRDQLQKADARRNLAHREVEVAARRGRRGSEADGGVRRAAAAHQRGSTNRSITVE